MKQTFLLISALFIAGISFSQNKKIKQAKADSFQHIEPPFWFTGMKDPSLQILFYDKNFVGGEYSVKTSYPGVTIKAVAKVDNPHYLFVTLDLGTAKAGNIPLEFTSAKKSFVLPYELRNKGGLTNRIMGASAADVVYLIMPDRFANGDVKNDTLPGMLEGTHRDKPFGRHGGDLKGISDHLDYIKDLGVTAIWLNPVLENNQKRASYHGYAITDFYQVDKRFGSNGDYVALINKSHQMGMKVIQDMVANHMGDENWLMKDLPSKDWVHQFPKYTTSNYRSTVISDPYRSKEDEHIMNDGWFDTAMPDINQSNTYFANYLIQNSLWWIEYGGIDGIRMDTYPYNERGFMTRWATAITNEYPSFYLVGEVWINSVPTTAYWQKNSSNKDGFQSNLGSVTDFPLYFSMMQGFNEEGGWDTGLTRLYAILAQDFSYPDPNNNLIFLDNHDLNRFYLSLGRDIRKFKLSLSFLMTTRGIPQIYYGTELLMDGDIVSHPNVRRDVPGGWTGDKTNNFTAAGRTPEQNDAYNFMKQLMTWRKSQPVIATGKLTQYVPVDNIYVYFRHNDEKTIMVIMNGNNVEKTLDTKRFAENIQLKTQATNVITGESIKGISSIKVPAMSALILDLTE